MTRSPLGGRIWPLLVLVAATIPVRGLFTLANVFYVRDLTLAFRSRFLFFRHSVWSGVWPLWDPYPANGQAAVNDALYQFFHFPSLPIRLLLPEVPAFNLWVAAPVPLAGLGAYLFLRRHVDRPAASLGAIAFAVAGPTVSTTNFPNLSWSVALIPFVFWSLERLAASERSRDGVLLAVVVAAQCLAGEPVTFAATALMAGAYAAWPLGGLRRWRMLAMAAVAMVLGVMLSAIQLIPLGAAGRLSVRAYMTGEDFWALHPLALLELLVPHFYGDYFHSYLTELVWMVALNSNRDPFYYTMYMGVPVLMLAMLAGIARRRDTTFWLVAIAVCLVASMGAYTPAYPALQAVVPGLKAFRFPVKYLSVAALGIATLAAFAFQWLMDDDAPRRPLRVATAAWGTLAFVTYLLIAWLLISPRTPLSLFYRLASFVGVVSPLQAAEFIIFRARPLLTALLLKIACGTFLLWIAASSRPERRLALVVLFGFTTVDLLFANSDVNPTMPHQVFDQPSWASQVPRDMHERLYVGGRLEGYVNTIDIDAPKYVHDIAGLSPIEQRSVVISELAFHTSSLHIREPLSYDLPLLWPLDYTRMLTLYKMAPRDERLRFLRRVGTRFAILPTPPAPGLKPLAQLQGLEQLRLWDFNPAAKRVYIVPDALRGPDIKWQIEGLFQERFDPSTGVLVSEPPPPPAGIAGMPVPASAEFVDDGINRVVVRAGLPHDGYLVLLDSYDPFWQVDVDGQPATLMRCNGVYRAVHLNPGSHTVTFTFRSETFERGALVSLATLVLLGAWLVIGQRRERPAAA